MLNKNNFFKNFSFHSKKLNQNLTRTKKIFKSFKSDLENFEIPLLQSYEKKYLHDFSSTIIKKYSKYRNIVIIGMGGSILGTKSIYSFFKTKINKNVFFFDNLDEDLHLKFRRLKILKNSCFIIISKSGNTLETITNLSVVFSKSLLKNKSIIITETKNNNLNDIANKINAEIIEHKNFIGGRFSVLSEVGMFPAALMGLNINRFKNLKKLIFNKNFVSSLIQNVANIYTFNMYGKKNSVILSYDSDLNDLGYWYQQLVAESLAKKRKGITPIISTLPRDHHSLLQLYLDGPKDKFFTFFSSSNSKNKYKVSGNIIPSSMKFLKNKKLKSIIDSQCEAAKIVFKSHKIPFRHFVFEKKTEEELGMTFTYFVLETLLLARLMNVNPFNQPAVEKIKIETRKILSR
ncbi:MAG: glucose-6-phosphate isomerase [Pelagibacteraceae bacterium]|jgi:glucose-6-phosphate isomerase|nr:glucose-6-phosphate isomerase [Pelagibacteraceae bacterium]MDP6710611.1 glucose-6-phosphate isomerase [Pelagibacteraceae bacterium]